MVENPRYFSLIGVGMELKSFYAAGTTLEVQSEKQLVKKNLQLYQLPTIVLHQIIKDSGSLFPTLIIPKLKLKLDKGEREPLFFRQLLRMCILNMLDFPAAVLMEQSNILNQLVRKRDLKCFFFSKLSFSYIAVKSSKDVLGCAFQCQKRNMEKNGACNSFHVTKVKCMNI